MAHGIFQECHGLLNSCHKKHSSNHPRENLHCPTMTAKTLSECSLVPISLMSTYAPIVVPTCLRPGLSVPRQSPHHFRFLAELPADSDDSVKAPAVL